MKLNVLSDLHPSQGALPLLDNDAGLVSLAGDIAPPEQAIPLIGIELGSPSEVTYILTSRCV